jgi:hypothetical protein
MRRFPRPLLSRPGSHETVDDMTRPQLRVVHGYLADFEEFVPASREDLRRAARLGLASAPEPVDDARRRVRLHPELELRLRTFGNLRPGLDGAIGEVRRRECRPFSRNRAES